MCWREEGEKRGSKSWVRDLKVGQMTLSKVPTREEIRSYGKELPFQVRGLSIH
jgi:hypothetical protein